MDSSGNPPTLLLLNRACSGDEQAVDALLRHVSARLTSLACRMLGDYPRVRRWVETGDVLQSATLRLLAALRDVRPAAAKDFFALAALQIRRELIDLARHYHGPNGVGAHHAPTPLHATQAHDPADVRSDPGSLAQWGELHERIQALPEEERDVVNLIYYQGLTQSNAAEILGLSIRTLQRRWHGTLVKLHRFWRGE